MLSSVKMTASVSGVLFYSPSGIDSYLKDNNTDKIAFCIGETTAAEARIHFETVIVSKLATVDGVIDSVNKYFNN